MVLLRKLQERDREELYNALKVCFSTWALDSKLDCLYNKSLISIVAIDTVSNHLVGFAGLDTTDLEYPTDIEVSWIGVLPKYRGYGIGSLLTELLIYYAISYDYKRLFWSAWKYGFCTEPNPIHILMRYGFQCVVPEHKRYKCPYNCSLYGTCSGGTGPDCSCSEDLYMLNL